MKMTVGAGMGGVCRRVEGRKNRSLHGEVLKTKARSVRGEVDLRMTQKRSQPVVASLGCRHRRIPKLRPLQTLPGAGAGAGLLWTSRGRGGQLAGGVGMTSPTKRLPGMRQS